MQIQHVLSFFDYCNMQLKNSHGKHIKEKAKITKRNQLRNQIKKNTYLIVW